MTGPVAAESVATKVAQALAEALSRRQAWRLTGVDPELELFVPELRITRGVAMVERWMKALDDQYPDFRFECRRILSTPNCGAIDGVLTSDRIGKLNAMGMEIAPQAVAISQPMLIVMHASDGKVSRMRAYYDRLRLFEALGFLGEVRLAGVADLPTAAGLVDDQPTTAPVGFSDTMYGLWNSGSRENIAAVFSEDCRLVSPIGEYLGRAGVMAYVDGFTEGFSDVLFEDQGEIGAGKTFIGEWRLKARNSGRIVFPGGHLPPTDHRFTLHGATLTVLESGTIRSYRAYFDRLEMMTDIGLNPT